MSCRPFSGPTILGLRRYVDRKEEKARETGKAALRSEGKEQEKEALDQPMENSTMLREAETSTTTTTTIY